MSQFTLKDGRSGRTAEVDNNNKLLTTATTETASTFAAMGGDSFTINSGSITLTSANASAILYMSNTDDRDWVFNRVFFNAAASTGGTGDWLAEIIANGTAGTLVSAGTAKAPQNLNFGSPKTLDATTLTGVEGSTVTDGAVRITFLIPGVGTRNLIGFDSVIVPPTASIAIRITPPAGNTSLEVQVGFNLHRVIEAA